ncbi:hypothetical protein T265_09676 [Opisthorchis viverrini]|uniref:Uncharacterized protein n=1 Tax=Opisthorchis viverrini TaxID=6198 RepID=A0A075A439_OPIVI|nr:hypothetical protein T265_09676 [Opisthorchis viverrini]KER22144.1 hypothetical protein T265_09676 [Opisthorchis viverrini]
MYICNALVIRLLKIRRQSTTGFALFGAHQVARKAGIYRFPLQSRSILMVASLRDGNGLIQFWKSALSQSSVSTA